MNQDETTTEQRLKRNIVKKRRFDPGPVRATGFRIHQKKETDDANSSHEHSPSQSQEQPKKKQKKQLRISDVVAIKSPPPPPSHVEQERKQKHGRQLRLSDVGFHSPPPRPPKDETKDDAPTKTPFTKFLTKNPNAPNVVLQGRIRFKQTPHEKTKRSNDCQNTVYEFLEQGSKKIFPNGNWTSDKRKQVIQPYVMNWFGDGSKCQLFYYDTPCH
jgi:hypothetical protein